MKELIKKGKKKSIKIKHSPTPNSDRIMYMFNDINSYLMFSNILFNWMTLKLNGS